MEKSNGKEACLVKLRASRDALEVIQGKWRIPIIVSLTYGNKRFGEIRKDIEDISPKMLSQELKELEMNKLIFTPPLTRNSGKKLQLKELSSNTK